jgi:hypothetical protein
VAAVDADGAEDADAPAPDAGAGANPVADPGAAPTPDANPDSDAGTQTDPEAPHTDPETRAAVFPSTFADSVAVRASALAGPTGTGGFAGGGAFGSFKKGAELATTTIPRALGCPTPGRR